MTWGGTTTKTRRVKPSYERWKPHAYQETASDFIANRGSGALFLDPGLGKTSIVLDAYCKLKKQKRIRRPMLVIAPLRVCQLVWRQEAEKWEQFRHLTFTFLHGKNKEKKLRDTSDVFLINPEGVPWLCGVYWGRSLPFDIVTIDELTRFKNAQSERHMALMPRLKGVRYRWGLTGTPIPNGYMDLFGQMKILDDGASLGFWFTHFRNKYFEKDYNGFTYSLRRGAKKAIEARIKPYALRMSADDYLQLPPLITDIRHVVMPTAARKKYEKLKKDTIVDLGGDTVSGDNAAAVYAKLKQMGNGAVYHGDGVLEPRKTIEIHKAKIEAIEDLVEELAGTPLLVGYEFNHDLARLRAALGDVPYLGKNVSGKKAEVIERNWNAGNIPILLAHPASAGHGLNLQMGHACHLAWFSMSWDYELYDQFIRRILRQGNKATHIFNHIFIVEDTIDNRNLEVINGKGLTQSKFFDALNSEIYREGKPAAPPSGATERDRNMVRKLSRRSKVKDQVEEDQVDDEDEDDGEEEPTPKTRRRRRASTDTEGTKRKLRRARQEDNGEDEDEDEDDGEDEDGEEPVQRRARRKFSKTVQKRLAADDDDGEEEEEEDDDEEEAPKPKRRGRPRKGGGNTTPTEGAKSKLVVEPANANIQDAREALYVAITAVRTRILNGGASDVELCQLSQALVQLFHALKDS